MSDDEHLDTLRDRVTNNMVLRDRAERAEADLERERDVTNRAVEALAEAVTEKRLVMAERDRYRRALEQIAEFPAAAFAKFTALTALDQENERP